MRFYDRADPVTQSQRNCLLKLRRGAESVPVYIHSFLHRLAAACGNDKDEALPGLSLYIEREVPRGLSGGVSGEFRRRVEDGVRASIDRVSLRNRNGGFGGETGVKGLKVPEPLGRS